MNKKPEIYFPKTELLNLQSRRTAALLYYSVCKRDAKTPEEKKFYQDKIDKVLKTEK